MGKLSKWFEVWIDESVGRPYFLIVTHDLKKPTRFSVLDPMEGLKLIYYDDDYDAVRLWLLEDEYTPVDGRMEND